MSIVSISKNQCSGCMLCGDICPKAAIIFKENEEGFYYPVVNQEKCVECGFCEKKCPINTGKTAPLGRSQSSETASVSAYAAFSNDMLIRKNSSSGGIFPVLAKHCLEQGGVVFGAAFDESWKVEHVGISSLNALPRICGSKYVQSDLQGIYSEVKETLMTEKQVLFSGVPCQVAALRNYLGQDYDNLLCVDLFCHGVSSPGLFENYLKETVGDLAGIREISFRDKTISWEKYNMKISTADGVYVKPFRKDPYLWAFCRRMSLRESCYRCKLKGFPKGSDITLGDMWTVDRIYPDMNDHNGISIVLTNTDKGQRWMESVRELCSIRKIEEAKFLDAYRGSGGTGKRPNGRDRYFQMAKTQSVAKATKKICRKPLKEKVMFGMRKVLIRFRIYEYARGLKRKLLGRK